jgi:hypothetical protein
MKKFFQSLSALMLLGMATVVSAGAYTPGTVTVGIDYEEGSASFSGCFNVRHNTATGSLGFITISALGSVNVTVSAQDSTTGAMFTCSAVSSSNPSMYNSLKRLADHAADGLCVSVMADLATSQCIGSIFQNSSKSLH